MRVLSIFQVRFALALPGHINQVGAEPEWGDFSAREFQAQDRPTFSMVVEIG